VPPSVVRSLLLIFVILATLFLDYCPLWIKGSCFVLHNDLLRRCSGFLECFISIFDNQLLDELKVDLGQGGFILRVAQNIGLQLFIELVVLLAAVHYL